MVFQYKGHVFYLLISFLSIDNRLTCAIILLYYNISTIELFLYDQNKHHEYSHRQKQPCAYLRPD